MTKPEPSELTLRDGPSFASKKSLNRSSKGEPFGPGPDGALLSFERFSVWVVEMLTTVFWSSSAMGATDSGPRARLAVLSIAGTARSTASAPALRPKDIRASALSVISSAHKTTHRSMLAQIVRAWQN